jgi:hypothetical protein
MLFFWSFGRRKKTKQSVLKKKSSTPIVSDRTDDKGGPDKNTKTPKKNLVQGPHTE